VISCIRSRPMKMSAGRVECPMVWSGRVTMA
jgi:hypothetical protein